MIFFHETTTFNIYDLDGNLIDTITEIKDFDGEFKNEFIEKENEKMITAEEAKRRSINCGKEFKECIKAIEEEINKACGNGKYSCTFKYSYINDECTRSIMRHVINTLIENGFDVTDSEYELCTYERSMITIPKRQLEISWK